MKRLVMVITVVSSLSVWVLAIPTTSAAPMPSRTARPENGRIVFRSWLNQRHTRGDLFTINSDGTGLLRVTHTPNGASTEPAPSPDGRWLVYMVIRHGNLDQGSVDFRLIDRWEVKRPGEGDASSCLGHGIGRT